MKVHRNGRVCLRMFFQASMAIHGGSPIAGGQNGLLQKPYESSNQNGRIPGGGCRRRPRQQAHTDPAQRSCIRGISSRQPFRVCRCFQELSDESRHLEPGTLRHPGKCRLDIDQFS